MKDIFTTRKNESSNEFEMKISSNIKEGIHKTEGPWYDYFFLKFSCISKH